MTQKGHNIRNNSWECCAYRHNHYLTTPATICALSSFGISRIYFCWLCNIFVIFGSFWIITKSKPTDEILSRIETRLGSWTHPHEAIQYFDRALEIFKISLPSEHPSIAQTYFNMGHIYISLISNVWYITLFVLFISFCIIL